MECPDQDLRDDDERRLASRPALGESPDELRDEEHAGAGDEPVAPRLAPVLPLGDEDLGPERGQDTQSRRPLELDQDRRERRDRDARTRPYAHCPPAREPHLVERPLAEAPEPAVKRAWVERCEPRRDLAQADATTQVVRDRPLDDPEGIDLPRRQICRQDAWSVVTSPALRDREIALLDTLLRTIVQEDRHPRHARPRQREKSNGPTFRAGHHP
jgi:hypothetical protein